MKFRMTKTNVKYLGRTCYYQGDLWLDWAGSGVSFLFTGKKITATFLTEATVKTEHMRPRVGICVNGNWIKTILFEELEETHVVYEGEKLENAEVKIVKISDAESSTMAIGELDVEGSIEPAKDKALKIEFLGDSITNGYGVEGDLSCVFSTATENAAKGYAMLTAKALDADYSLVALSGHGIISGYTGDGVINKEQLIMPYYETLGKSYGKFADTLSPGEVKWDFSEFQPDIVVINLGTNDNSYCLDYADRAKVFEAAYIEALKLVRKCNPTAYIVCTLGLMGKNVFPNIENAVKFMKEETGDERMTSFYIPEQKLEDGYGVDYHPTEKTQNICVEELTAFLKEKVLPKLS